MYLCYGLITTWSIGSYAEFISKIGNKKRRQCTEIFVSSRWGPFSYLIRYAAYEVRCTVPLVSDLPDVVIYEWHCDSCVLRCIRDVDRDWLSLGSHVDNQFNISCLEFFPRRGNQTITLSGHLQVSALIILKLCSTVQTLHMPLIVKNSTGNNECVYINVMSSSLLQNVREDTVLYLPRRCDKCKPCVMIYCDA
jgi:hypothetical protein